MTTFFTKNYINTHTHTQKEVYLYSEKCHNKTLWNMDINQGLLALLLMDIRHPLNNNIRKRVKRFQILLKTNETWMPDVSKQASLVL